MKVSIYLAIIILLSKVIGFGRELVLANFYGVSNISDAYLISLTITGAIFTFIGEGINANYIPIYNKISIQESEKSAETFTNNLITVLLFLCTILTLLGFFFAKELVGLFASGFQEETSILATNFTKISFFGMYFILLFYVFTGYLQIKKNYLMPAIAGLAVGLVATISIYMSVYTSIYFLAIGTLVSVFARFVILIPSIFKSNYNFKFIFKFKNENLKKMLFLSIPIIIGVSINQINVLVDRSIATHITIGGVSALSYANILTLLVHGVFIISIVTVIYPILTKMVSVNDFLGVKKIISDSMISISLIVLPATIIFILFSEQITKLIFGRGAFDSNAILLTSTALMFYAIGLIGIGQREFLTKVFYSMQDTKTPMFNSVIGLIINITLNIILSQYIGLGGLALASSISAIVTSSLLLFSLRNKIGNLGIKNISFSFIKILCSSLVMGLIAKLIFIGLHEHWNSVISLLIAILIAMLTYCLMIYLFKIKEVDVFVELIKRKRQKVV